MDDLKLSVVIEALLSGKGFEEARANLKSVAAQAGAAAVPVTKAGDAAKKMGESFGGTRGPVADLTRILLQNVGVTGAAGEAAKAAGTAMYFMEGAASAAALATSGIVAAIAFGLPLLIKWLSSTKEQTEEQHNLRDSLESTSELISKLIEDVPLLAEKYRETAAALHSASLDKQSDRLRELLNRQGELQKKIADTTSEWQKQNFAREIEQLQAEVRLLMQAQEQNLTVTEMVTAERKKHTPIIEKDTKATKEKTEAVKQLTLAEKMAIEQEGDALVDRITLTQKQDKAKAKAAADEAQLILDRMALEREDARVAAEVAEAKRINQLQAVGYVGQALTALSALFGRNKALAIAGAIADTYAGAALALRTIPPPAGWAAAAATIAQGLVAVQNIRKANPEGGPGFDDPFADLTARRLGRKSAMDFVANFGAEFIPGVRAGMGAMGGVTHHHTTINRGVTHNYGGISGLMAGSPTAFARGLDRAMTKAGRFRRRTTLGR